MCYFYIQGWISCLDIKTRWIMTKSYFRIKLKISECNTEIFLSRYFGYQFKYQGNLYDTI